MTRKTLSLFGLVFLALSIITVGVFNMRDAAAAQDVVKIGFNSRRSALLSKVYCYRVCGVLRRNNVS
jgi:hypothetical protein